VPKIVQTEWQEHVEESDCGDNVYKQKVTCGHEHESSKACRFFGGGADVYEASKRKPTLHL